MLISHECNLGELDLGRFVNTICLLKARLVHVIVANGDVVFDGPASIGGDISTLITLHGSRGLEGSSCSLSRGSHFFGFAKSSF